MKKLMTALAVAGLMVAQSASALDLYNDTLTWSSGGIVATPNWNDEGTWLSWKISQDPTTMVWTYSYDWHTDGRNLSHINIQVSDGATLRDFSNWKFSHKVNEGSPVIELLSPTTGNSNPGMPGDLYGMKIDLADGVNTPVFGFSFQTMRAPVWGDFYAKDGVNKDDKVNVYAYNAGFLIEPDNKEGHIAVPNGPSIIIVPDGGLTLGLMGLSLLGLGGLRRRFRS